LAEVTHINALDVQPALTESRRLAGPTLSIIVPTFNEAANIEALLSRLDDALLDLSWEVVFVDDDSTDGTSDLVRAISQRDARVRCIQRIGRRGLSSACIEGMLASSAPFIAVMDADLQHDERILQEMLRRLRGEDLDIVVGSRYTEGGGVGDWQNDRAAMSRFATKLSRLVVHADLKDPMSGFFMLRRDAFMRTTRRLSSLGFKILLDIFASAPAPLKFCEVPYEFRPRYAGESKLDSVAMWDYGMLLLDKLIGHVVPVRFVMFSLVGVLGLGIHLTVLALMVNAVQTTFDLAQTTATVVAMTGNFLLNNYLTYRDKRLRGLRLISGLLTFYAACGLGAIANIGAASYVFQHHYSWWLSGIAGVAIGAVWNYAATSLFTWRNR
jgi:dolichol-phosphate mannosyltransferase